MSTHVDLVENRWSGGYQERVGTVSVSGGAAEVMPSQERYAHYRDVVLEAMPDVMAGSAENWPHRLPQHFHSDYFFATEPHDEQSCPFAGGDQVALNSAATAARHAIPA